MRRVWLRGIGAICSAGNGASEILAAARAGERTFGHPRYTPTIPDDAMVGEAKFSAQPPTRSWEMLKAALHEAVVDARMPQDVWHNAGIFVGTTSGLLQAVDFESYERQRNGEPYTPRMSAPGVGAVAEVVAEMMGARGPQYTFTSACTSSCIAAMEAWRMIREGDLDTAIVIGFESILKTTFHGFKSMMLYDERGCRPFDITRAGMTLGEGAGILILSKDRAPDSVAHCACEVVSASSLTEPHNLTAQSHDGSSGAILWQRLCDAGHFTAADVTAVKVHGTGTLDNDVSEAAAMRRLFPDPLQRPPFVGLKGLVGHSLGAAGGLEIAIWTACVRAGFLPKTVGFETPDPELGLLLASENHTAPNGVHVLQFFGFGGSSAAIALRYHQAVVL